MAKKDKTESVVELPSERVLRSLVSLTNKTREKTGLLSGELGQAIKDAADRHNLHAGAFKLVAKLKRMDPVRLRGFLDHFDAYRDTLKIDDLKASDMFEDGEEEAAPKKARGKAKDGDDGKPSAEVVNIKDRQAEAASA